LSNCKNSNSFTEVKSTLAGNAASAYHGGPQIVISEGMYNVNSTISSISIYGYLQGVNYRIYGEN
jgi:hypothetical protein